MTTIYGLSGINVPGAIPPMLDIPAASITAAYTTPVVLSPFPIAILVMQNSTNVLIDVAFDFGFATPISTNFRLLPGQTYPALNLKTNHLPLSASIQVSVKADSALPASGYVSFSMVVISS